MLSLAPLERVFVPVRMEDPRIKAIETRLIRAQPIPIERVRVLGGPLKHAQDLTAVYLISLDPDRMMAYYRIRAGLPKKAEPYDGWDGDGRNLTGHIAGHHLSAVSLMYAATGDARFKTRADYLVAEMKVVQDKNGDGYLGAIEHGREAFAAVSKGDIKSGGFDLNGLWSPWYTLHKTFAGLRDAYRFTGNHTALDVETKYAGWAEHVLAPLSDTQVQKMLNTEHGGMNEVLADLYADTGDKRWLDLSYRFEHRAFTDALKRHEDNLSGKHGNCQIPKLIGSAARYGYTADTADILAASFFWDRVVEHHSYATGGHGLAEYFGPPDRIAARADGRACESCNVYNMLKLTRRLFSFSPDAHYADFYERALFNHVLASIDPEDGRTSYMVPVGRAVQQEYQDMQHSFTCCVGTGMENHALHGAGIYFESPETVWVNLFVPSEAHLVNHGVHIAQESDFPDGERAKLTLTMPSPAKFTLAVRRPVWAGDAFVVRVNGELVAQAPLATLRDFAAGGRTDAPGNEATQSSAYVHLDRTWRSGDVVELTLPKSLRVVSTPDDKKVAAIMWGPLALAADLGPRREGRNAPDIAAPVLVGADRPVSEWLMASNTRVGDFRAQQIAHIVGSDDAPGDVAFAPFYRTHRRTYSVYVDVLTSGDFETRTREAKAERERTVTMEASTTAFVKPGDPQSERSVSYKSEPADRAAERNERRSARGGAGWFSYNLAVDATRPIALVLTYYNEPGIPPTTGQFAIFVDGTEVGRFAPNAHASGFYSERYSVPSQLTVGKTSVTVKFQADERGRIAPIYGVRVIRAD